MADTEQSILALAALDGAGPQRPQIQCGAPRRLPPRQHVLTGKRANGGPFAMPA